MPKLSHRLLPILLSGSAVLSLGGCSGTGINIQAMLPSQLTTTAEVAANGNGSNHATHEYMLANGMKVIVREDHRAPVVISQIWYKVGASYEHIGITGVSHVLEHMMFKGTDKHPPGEFSRIIAENGGRENAFTGRDFTSYFQQLEASRLPIAFELEADRMRNLHLQEAEFRKERDVVIEERRLRTEDKPSALTYEKFMATAFQVNPYHNPVIGWMDDLKSLTLSDLSRWYQTWYSPNNATLVVVGDVDPEAVHSLARKYFGRIPPSTLPDQKPRTEPPQQGERRVTVLAPAEVPVLIMGYKTPVLRTVDQSWKAYALEVLANVLDGGDSARISRELVRGQAIAASAGASYDLIARHDSLLTLEGTPAQGQKIATLEKALRDQVSRLHRERISSKELARIKAQVTANKVYELDSVFYQAMQIGMLETIGLQWQEAEHYAERINAVTAEQVQQVAREFLIDDNLTVATLQPLPINGKQVKGGDHAAH
ncbi:MAG: insulinase family protein [Chromatiales bacterium]|nr:insulinase family protein [Chromatiales bacterium]